MLGGTFATWRTVQNADKSFTPHASTCNGSIPVPLANVSWGFDGDAINTLQNQPSTGTTWTLNSCSAPSPAQPGVVSSSVFPLWNTTVANKP
jgi:hypothetical protein